MEGSQKKAWDRNTPLLSATDVQVKGKPPWSIPIKIADGNPWKPFWLCTYYLKLTCTQ